MQVDDATNNRVMAELIFTGGKVYTVNARNDIVEAIAVGGRRILAVGSAADVRSFAGQGTRKVPLRGGSLLPAFIDAHCHLTASAWAWCRSTSKHQLCNRSRLYRRRSTNAP